MPKGIPLTQEELDNRRRTIFDAAVGLLQEKGFQETSMREIAQAAGMGKSSLYDYFGTKDEILMFIIEEETRLLTQQAQAIAASNIPPDARLRQLIVNQLHFMQANESLLMRLNAETQRLKPESQRQIQAGRYVYQNLVCAVIEEGIAQGCFRRVHPLNAARLLINSLLSVLYTTRPTGTPDEMLEEALAIFLDGIRMERI